MNRLNKKFIDLRKSGQKAFVPFITGGDPNLSVTRQVLRYCDSIGVDCIEIGIPFSDPLADGPVIQASFYRALKSQVTLRQILKLVKSERKKGLQIPIVVMSSLNPIQIIGVDNATQLMIDSGIDGCIIPDLPYEESESIRKLMAKKDLCSVLMTTPTTQAKRHRRIVKSSRGFLYYVSLIGLTGDNQMNLSSLTRSIASSRKISKIPICLGFGISKPDQILKLRTKTDGIIVGSALVKELHKNSRRSLSLSSKKLIKRFLNAVKGKRVSLHG